MVGDVVVVAAAAAAIVVIIIVIVFIVTIVCASPCASIENKGAYVVAWCHRSIGRAVGNERILEGGMQR